MRHTRAKQTSLTFSPPFPVGVVLYCTVFAHHPPTHSHLCMEFLIRKKYEFCLRKLGAKPFFGSGILTARAGQISWSDTEKM